MKLKSNYLYLARDLEVYAYIPIRRFMLSRRRWELWGIYTADYDTRPIALDLTADEVLGMLKLLDVYEDESKWERRMEP